MKELINKVEITGKLVAKDINEFITKTKGEDAIGGSLVIRTSDGSEHEVEIYSGKFKKDEKKQATSELNYFYNEYMKIVEHCKDISEVGADEASVISINGSFIANDFLNPADKTKIVSNNKINARFVNKIEEKDIETTPLVAKFEVEGIVESITDEVIKDVPTGNLVVRMNAIRQTADGFGKDAKYEVDSLIPIKMIVGKDMVAAFRSAGYYDGCFAKFVGTLINTKEVVETIEKQAFGEDKVDRKTLTVKKYEIKSGSLPSTFFEHELDQTKVDALIAKRKQALAEVRAGKTTGKTNNEVAAPAPKVAYNPFAQQ
ncbi:MAG: hypothetical protein RSF40_01280 [Oscillospiraceae bacterium]